MSDAVLSAVDVEADLLGLHAVHADPRVYTLDPADLHRDLEDTRRFLRPMAEHWERHGFGYWTVRVPASWWPDGTPEPGVLRVAGLAGVQHHLLGERDVLNVYYRFAPEVQGRGLAGLAVRAAVASAREVAPDLDLVVRTRPANAAARRVAEREGFVDEGLSPHEEDMQLLRLRQR